MLHLFVSPEVPGIVVDREIKRVRIIAPYLSPYIESGKMLGIENRQIANNRYQGNLAGFGISYGYQWMISPQWNLEAGLSLGYAHLNYKRYGQPEGAAFIEKSHCNYWGPTQIGISLVYFIQ